MKRKKKVKVVKEQLPPVVSDEAAITAEVRKCIEEKLSTTKYVLIYETLVNGRPKTTALKDGRLWRSDMDILGMLTWLSRAIITNFLQNTERK